MKKRIIAIMMAVLMLVSTVFVFASESNGVSELEMLQNNQQLQMEIDAYFNAKLSDSSNARTYNVGEVSELQRNAAVRASGLMEMQERADIEFANVDIDSEIRNVVEQSEEKIVLDVYEWTAVEYYASPDATVTDIMGYGINHEMIFDVVDGEYILVADSFDERHITGVCSDDILLAEAEEAEFVEDVPEMTASANTTEIVYNVNAAIDYANMYCGVDPASQDFSDVDGTRLDNYNSSNYNSAYTPYLGVDCANFVSQCLFAGGLTTDSTWNTSTVAWVNARGLAEYLESRGYESKSAISENYGNVYPGNPVYWVNSPGSSTSGHQMICTGYNSAGKPVVNGHNHDMFRYPISLLNHEDHDIRTMQIVTSDQHTHVREGAYNITASSHYLICKHCRNIYNYGAHNIVTVGGLQKCSVCLYRGPFAADYSLSILGEPGTDTRPRE